MLFEYFNIVGGPPTWDSLTWWATESVPTRQPTEWLKIEFLN